MSLKMTMIPTRTLVKGVIIGTIFELTRAKNANDRDQFDLINEVREEQGDKVINWDDKEYFKEKELNE